MRRGYEAFARVDLPALAELFDENVVWHNPGVNPVAGDFTGRDNVFAMFAETLKMQQGTGHFDVRDILADDDYSVSLLHATASCPDVDKHLDVRELHVFRYRDGRISEAWVFSLNQPLNDEFWA